MSRNREVVGFSALPEDRVLIAKLGRALRTTSTTAIMRAALLDAAKFRGLVLVQGAEREADGEPKKAA